MFDFLKVLDIKLIAIISQLENDIKYKSGNTIVTIQTFCEVLLKLVEYKETNIIVKRKSLGQYLDDERFASTLLNDLYIDTQVLSKINKSSNLVKHQGKYKYDEHEIESYVEFIFYMSKGVLKYYYSELNIEPEFDDKYFKRISELNDDLEKYKEQFEFQVSEKTKEFQLALKNALAQKEILEKRIKSTEKEKDTYKEQIKQLEKLEIELRIKDTKISELRDDRTKLEEKLNEKETIEKKKLEKEIRLLKSDSNKLKKEIDELRSKDIIDPKIKIDRDSKILDEKNKEIEELKALIANQEVRRDEKQFKLYKRNSLQLGFSSSYVNDDEPFIITGISKEASSSSKYKSFYAVLNNILQRGYVVNPSSYLEKKKLNIDDLKEVYRIELAILSLIRNNKLKDRCWNINLIGSKNNNLKIACEDIIYWIELLTSISKITYIKPELKLSFGEFKEEFINIKYDNKISYENDIYNIIDCLMVDEEDKSDFFSMWIDDYIKYDVSKYKIIQLEKILKEIFGFEHFNEGQFEILEHTMNGNSTIGILPTGGGKSLIYQFASLLEPKIAIIVAPINSLIKDQIDGLNRKFKITRCLNITSSNDHKNDDEKKLKNGNALFVFLSPERFQINSFRKILMSLSFDKAVERIVLDEVHCLSEWGHDFRIPYLMLADTLNSYCGDDIKYLGLTATAAKSVIEDLIVELRMTNKDVIFLKKLRRKNLTFHFKNFESKLDMGTQLLHKVEEVDPILNFEKTKSMIIFCRTKGGLSQTSIENTYKTLFPLYGDMLETYHGQLSVQTKDLAQDNFISNKKSILIATKAFGMGIDKPNIRCTIHYGIPNSFESFYQEAGRAGRDGNPSDCYVYTYKLSQADMQHVSSFFNQKSSVEDMKKISGYLKFTDLSTNLWFFTHELYSPREEASSAHSLYNILVNQKNPNEILIPDNSNWDKEKVLYILHKIGIVSNWEKDYMSHILTIHLTSYYKDIEYIKNAAIKYISQYQHFETTQNEIVKISSINQLGELIYIIREWYFKNFVLGRKSQISNMIEKIQRFSNRDCSEDIQREIDAYFDLTNIIDKTEEGYSLDFKEESFSDIVDYITKIEDDKIEKRKIEMGRVLESVTTPNINLYTSLLYLKSGDFNSLNGRDRFEFVYTESSDRDKTDIMISLADKLYIELKDEIKEILLDNLYKLDYARFRSVFLEHVKEDAISKKYWIPYINEKINKLMKGDK